MLAKFGMAYYENPDQSNPSDPSSHLVECIKIDERYLYFRVNKTVKKDLLIDAFSSELDYWRGKGKYKPVKRHTAKIAECIKAYALEARGETHEEIARILDIPKSTAGYRCREFRAIIKSKADIKVGSVLWDLPCTRCNDPGMERCTPNRQDKCIAFKRFMRPLDPSTREWMIDTEKLLRQKDDPWKKHGHKWVRPKVTSDKAVWDERRKQWREADD